MGTNDAYLASKTRLFYGGSDFLADLSGFASAANLAGRTIAENITVLSGDATEIDALRVGHTLRPGPLYAGPNVDTLRGKTEGIMALVFLDSNDGVAYPAIVNGLGRNANVERLIQRGVTFVQAGAFVDGTADGTNTRLVSWEKGANPTVTVAVGDVGYLIVTEGFGAFSGAVGVTTTAPGIVDATGLKSGTLTTPAGSSGYLLTGKQAKVD